jgi:hypothetical protein
LPGALHQFLPVSGYIFILYRLLRGVLGALNKYWLHVDFRSSAPVSTSIRLFTGSTRFLTMFLPLSSYKIGFYVDFRSTGPVSTSTRLYIESPEEVVGVLDKFLPAYSYTQRLQRGFSVKPRLFMSSKSPYI